MGVRKRPFEWSNKRETLRRPDADIVADNINTIPQTGDTIASISLKGQGGVVGSVERRVDLFMSRGTPITRL